MIRYFQILIILLLFSCNSQKNKPDPGEPAISDMDMLEPDHDTLPNGKRWLNNIDSSFVMYYKEVVGADSLEGGYVLCYGIDDSTKYLYLRKGDTLHLLNQTPIYTSTWSLGTLEEDFANSFMTRIDNGNSTPSTYQLFDKRTGKNILGDQEVALSYAYLQDALFMLYNKTKSDSIMLFNTKTLKKERYKLPGDIPEFYDIHIDTLTKNNLRIIYSSYLGDYTEKTKTYIRPGV